jgi:hypothetical protein
MNTSDSRIFVYCRLPRGVYPSRIFWNDPTTLAIACAQTIKIMTITTEAHQEHQSSAPKKYMNTGLKYRYHALDSYFYFFLAILFNIEFYACGLTSVNRDLVILGIENFSISVKSIL